MIVDDINGVSCVLLILVYKFRVFVDLPEYDLSVKAARQEPVLCIGIESEDVALMSVMRVHIGHLTNVPDLKASIIRNSVELIIFSVELDRGDGVSMTHKGLNLLLVVDVPNSQNTILTSTH